MKKVCKVLSLIIGVFILLLIGGYFFYYTLTYNAKINENKLINLDRTVVYYYENGDKMAEISNNTKIVNIDELNAHTINAFIAVEDKRFYEHNGIDNKRLFSALINNIKSFSFKEGASTITQQLIKNTHLSNDKTIKRKLIEINLAQKLEKKYSKKQILEMYLNTIYFGDNCYGITAASEHYFNKTPKDLSINESAVLAGIIKAPSHYSPLLNKEKCFNRKNLVLKLMKEQGYISDQEYEHSKSENIKLSVENNNPIKEYDYLYITKQQRTEDYNKNPYALIEQSVHTHCNKNYQNILKEAIESIDINCLKSAILLDKQNNVKAYFSNCGDIPRQLGSTLKPLAVYAPAIENDVVASYTYINDQKININGYAPSNYKDKYYGKVTVKEAVAKSLNSCAVKVLNYTGIENSLKYINNTQLEFTENDKTLALALGCCENGNTLSNLSAAYSVFINNGNYCNVNTIKNKSSSGNKVFSDDTVGIMNEILKHTVTNGTAKRLSELPFAVYAKTGTVGSEKGNSDAYVVSYTSDYVLGVWIGNQGELLDNKITGGTTPCVIAKKIWEKIYNKNKPVEIENTKDLTIINIDKISYNEDDVIELADDKAPKRYVETILIKNKDYPSVQSTRFSKPKIKTPKLSINNNTITISLCLPEYYNAELIRCENNKITTKNILKSDDKAVIDKNIKPDTEYTYTISSYFLDTNGNKIYGEEIIIGKIKTPSNGLGENWWIDNN